MSKAHDVAATSLSQPGVAGDLGDQLGVRWFHVGLFAVCLVAQQPMVAAVATSPYKLPEVKEEFGLDNSMASFVVTSVVLGSMVGVILCGYISDCLGRRKGILIFNVALGLLNLLHLGVPHAGGFYVLVALRALVGVPYAGLLMTVVPYFIEFFPNHVRGAAGVSLALAWPLGTTFSLIFMSHFEDTMGWRTCFATTPLVMSALAILCLSFVPESPRWCMVAGRPEEAQRTLDAIVAQPLVCGRGYVGKAPAPLMPETPSVSSGSSTCSGSTAPSSPHLGARISHLFSPELRRSTTMASLIYVSLAGVANSLWAWGPSVLAWVTGGDVGLGTFQYAQAACATGVLVMVILVDRVGRRKTIVFLFVSLAAAFAALALHPTMNWTVAIWLCYQVGDAALWSVVGTYMNEVFPTEVRGTAAGFCAFWGRAASVLAPMGVGALIDGMCHVALLIFIGLYLCTASIFAAFAEETVGRPLPDECGRAGERRASGPEEDWERLPIREET